MFTGLIETTATVLGLEEGSEAWQLRLAPPEWATELEVGESVAVDGCCLTVASLTSSEITFDVLEQTLRLTHFTDLKTDDIVNLERSVPAGGRMGGHFVSGHIDGVGEIVRFEQEGKNFNLCIAPAQSALLRYVVDKGSIAVDGISLTVAKVSATEFALWIIPHTLAVTSLKTRQVGDTVNLEFDLLAKYTEKIIQSGSHTSNPLSDHESSAPFL